MNLGSVLRLCHVERITGLDASVVAFVVSLAHHFFFQSDVLAGASVLRNPRSVWYWTAQ
jgi:hypothetical protein